MSAGGRTPPARDDPYWCDDVDVYCYMGQKAPAGKSMFRIPAVRGSVRALIPRGTVLWCRDGDERWTEFVPEGGG